MDASASKVVPQAEEENLGSLPIVNVEKGVASNTEDGSVDRKGNPAIKGKSGGWTSAALLLVNQGLVTLAFFGVGVNLVLFLTRVLQQDTADAANNVSKWTGTVYIFSLIGAFMSDSYWGRYLTCAVFQIIFVLGLVLLSVSSWLLLVKPSGCGDGKMECSPPSMMGTSAFYISIYLIAFGNGGYQPSIATFGSDQFDENDPAEGRSKVTFFSYFYFALNAGSLFSNTVLVYYEDSGKWAAGFWASAASAIAALLLFYAGAPRYRHFKPSGNPLTRIAQVFVAAALKWEVVAPVEGEEQQLYEVEGKQSAIAGSRKIPHTQQFRFLDKAATLTTEEYHSVDAGSIDPWRLCTVTQVEEVKRVLELLPVWLCTIIYSIVFTQMASLFVEQGDDMDTTLGSSFHIPAASMSAFDIFSVLIVILLYRRVLEPAARRVTGDPRGLTELHRMGLGLLIAVLAMVVSGLVELERLRRVDAVGNPSRLSILWQIPQYALVGASEVFMYVGQLEFFSGQAPDGLKSLGSSLCMASISLGNYFSTVLVSSVVKLTSGERNPGWIPRDLNGGHLDRFYFLLAALTAVDLVAYVICARRYKFARAEDGEVNKGEEQGTVERV